MCCWTEIFNLCSAEHWWSLTGSSGSASRPRKLKSGMLQRHSRNFCCCRFVLLRKHTRPYLFYLSKIVIVGLNDSKKGAITSAVVNHCPAAGTLFPWWWWLMHVSLHSQSVWVLPYGFKWTWTTRWLLCCLSRLFALNSTVFHCDHSGWHVPRRCCLTTLPMFYYLQPSPHI